MYDQLEGSKQEENVLHINMFSNNSSLDGNQL